MNPIRHAVPVLAALVASLAVAAPAEATFPGANGQIAKTGSALTVGDPRGRVFTTLEPVGPDRPWPYPTDPAFLPDGEHIVYDYGAQAGPIFVIATDGTDRMRLTDPSVGGDDPTPSPSGEIVFVTKFRYPGQVNSNADLVVMDGDGSSQRPLVAGPTWDWQPAFSPDGKRIAFVRQPVNEDGYFRGAAEVLVMAADGSGLTRLAEGNRPQFTPDGERIIFVRGGKAYGIDADGSNEQPLSPTQPFSVNAAVASPSGRKLALSHYFERDCDMWDCAETGYEIYTSAADVSEPRLLTTSGANEIDWGPAPAQPRPVAMCGGEEATITGTEVSDGITGTGRQDRVAALGSTYAIGTEGLDVTRARRGADVVCGGMGRDHMFGGPGPDLLIGEAGSDLNHGGGGDDRIEARDEEADDVSCGRGRDIAIADRRDEIAPSCERLRMPDDAS